jgi:heme-degrading monooxygenase HmoA
MRPVHCRLFAEKRGPSPFEARRKRAEHLRVTEKGVCAMIAVIFEVWPASGRKEDYLAIAATLRAELEKIDGFISVERFQSLTDAGKLLSLSFWRDEEAVARWRNQMRHRESQAAGRGGVFADYRLRIASVVRDYGITQRAEAPADSRAYHKA